jgi:hypothetical protein
LQGNFNSHIIMDIYGVQCAVSIHICTLCNDQIRVIIISISSNKYHFFLVKHLESFLLAI